MDALEELNQLIDGLKESGLSEVNMSCESLIERLERIKYFVQSLESSLESYMANCDLPL